MVAAPQGGIMGVYSTSEKTPVKAGGFGIAVAATVFSKHLNDEVTNWRVLSDASDPYIKIIIGE